MPKREKRDTTREWRLLQQDTEWVPILALCATGAYGDHPRRFVLGRDGKKRLFTLIALTHPRLDGRREMIIFPETVTMRAH